MAVQSLSKLSLQELEQTIVRYPWFAAARHELFMRQVKAGRDAAEAAANVALFVPSRAALYRAAYGKESEAAALAADEVSQAKSKYVLAGSDYFSRSDFEDLEKRGEAFCFSRINLTGLNGAASSAETTQATVMTDASSNTTEVNTETLAKIYTLQGHYDRAIEVYKKLILLYPEKSAYFATLIDKIETKIKNI